MTAALVVLFGRPLRAQTFLISDGPAINSCSGNVYDSGGAGGNYGNSEDLTTTICPTGGGGSGLPTVITIVSWNVQAGAADQLVIHDGPTTGAPVLATGNGNNPLTGQTFTGTTINGCLTLRWTSDASTVAAGWNAVIGTAPDAGVNGSNTVCSSSAAFNLFNSLGGTPDPGGDWTAPGNVPHSAIYDPAVDAGGVYTYTVSGGASCSDAVATVTVVENPAVNAGTNGSIGVCSNELPFSLFGLLGGSPDNTGSWTGPGNTPVSGTYTPGTSTPGQYTYTVVGLPPCANAVSTVTVNQTAAPNAGTNASVTVCSTGAVFNMQLQLGGNPQNGGTWTRPNGTTHPNSSFNPAVDLPGDWTYTVAGAGPCADASATLTVVVRQAPDAGANGSITVCSTDASFALIDELGGSPDVNGAWTAPGGVAFGGNFTPGVHAAGVYTYTVPGQAPCAADVSTVTVTVNQAPNAGGNASIAVCSSDAAFNMFNLLTGAPQAGGSWSGPSNTTGTFNPATMLPGVYTYTRTGLAPCSPASATVTVSVSTAPDAGSNATVNVCSNGSAFSLFDALNGDPDANGTWTAPGGAGHSSTFDPSTDVGGVYTYTVPGNAPCANDVSTVTVNRTVAPNAGTSTSLTVCSDDGITTFLPLLGGADAGGSWIKPGGASHPPGNYDPANPNHPAGVYTYTVDGTGPCADAQSTITVTENQAPRAGTDGSVSVCSNGSAFALLSVLGGGPNGNGSWTAPGGGASNGTFTPGVSPAGQYRYVVTGTAPCDNDTSFVTVNVVPPPDPGTNGTVTVCSNAASFPLAAYLGGNAQVGGTWRNPQNQIVAGGNYVPGTSQPGIYTYTVTGTSPCANESATVTVTQVAAPNAGSNGTRTVCSNMAPLSLFLELGGSPQAGGTWTGPGGAHNGTFVPGTDPAGVYTYIVLGTLPCANAQASVTMVVNPAPNPGGDGNITVCEDVVLVDLFDALVGSYDPGGTWIDQDNTGELTGSFLNTGALSPGTYDFEYEVPGIGMCPDASAQVEVTVVQQLNAGADGSDDACDTETNVDLFDALSGNAQSGGTWTQLNGLPALTGGFFNATINGAGTYQFKYRLEGTTTCDADSSEVTVNVVAGPNAGSNGVLSICGNGPAVPLINLLGNSPDAGGQWSGPGGSMNGVYDPAQFAPGTYTYTVNGTPPCAADQSTVQVSETAPPNAGTSAVITVCSNEAPFSMRDKLGGSPATNGAWVGPGGQAVSNTFVPGVSSQGVYTYTVPGVPPCNSASSTLTVSVSQAPFAGNDATYTTCGTAGQFVMVNLLGGGAQLGGSWTGPGGAMNGIYDPAVHVPGVYTYTVTGSPPCIADVALLEIFENPAAEAGASVAINICSNGGSVLLIDSLGGVPDMNGVWTDPSNQPFGGTFAPSQHAAGTYTYTVPGQFPCASDQSTVDVVVDEAPDAGISNSLVVCSSQSSFLLVDQLGGDPDLGTWTGPNNQFFNGLFVPGVSAAGTYTYTVAGSGACPSATSTIAVNVNTAPFAGQDGTLTVCSNSGSVNLLTVLVGEQPGGTWTRPGGLAHSGILLPGINPSGVYTYTVTGQAPCVADQSTVTVTINVAPSAGINNDTTICDNSQPFVLIDLLGGSPANGGVWRDPNNAVNPGIYIPGSSAVPGVYTYTVSGVAPCSTATATVTVIQNNAPDAGGNNTITVCSDEPAFQLLSQLSGTPDNNGQWTDPSNDPTGGQYLPGTSDPGTYTYFIDGSSPCPDDQSTLTVIENTAPDAGISTAILVCSNEPAFLLIDRLAGTPAIGGSWSGGTNGLFIPGTSPSGTYTYTVTGTFPCGTAQASVQVTVVQAADAGSNGNVTACVDDPGIDLFAHLNGSPQPGGSWSDDDNTGQLTNGLFDATGIAPGTYQFTYAVDGAGPCADDQAVVTVEVVNALNAGSNTQVDLCDSQTSVDLFQLLGGSPQAGGAWIDLDNTGALINGVFNAAQAGLGTWDFRYVLGTSSQCDPDSSVLTVTVLDGPNAGSDDAVQLCSTGVDYDLDQGLGPGADGNGQWFTPSWTAHSNLFDPSVDPAGLWHYVVPAVGACAADTSQTSVGISTAPDAGGNETITICSDVPPFSLNSVLQGEDAGGSWTLNGVNHSGVYNPSVDGPGVYVYQVTGQLPCAPDVSTVTVSENPAANAGNDASTATCSNDPGFSLISQLGGSPQNGGAWTGPGGGSHGPVFNPANDITGTYTYVIIGTAPCVNDTATLYIQNTPAPDAGDDASIEACAGQVCVDLLDALGGTPDSIGIWADLDATGAVSGNCFNATLVSLGVYHFRYVVPSAGICSADTNFVTVEVTTGASAGVGDTLEVCGGLTAFDLFPTLGGNPDPGGTWADVFGTGALNGSVLDVSALPPGGPYPFQYTVTDPNCGDVSAVVLISATAYPDPGGDSTLALCINAPVFTLFDALVGTPDAGGDWTSPGGGNSDGTFAPGTDTPGDYTYTLVGNAFCPDTTATITVVVNELADAGVNGELLACDTATAVNLFSGLGGTPQAGGVWTDLDGTGALSGGVFDASGVAPGQYEFQYDVVIPGCGSDDAIVKVTVVEGVELIAVAVDCNEQERTYVVSFTIAQGDSTTYSVTGVGGTLSPSAPYVFVSDPIVTSQPYSITVSDQYGCAPITIAGVSPCGFTDDVFVPESYSPNGDGINEAFIIPGIEGFPDNTIAIFNRWGNQVYEAAGYNNSTVVWEGKSTSALIPGDLPAGTYYYVLKLSDDAEAIRGYVYLNR